MINIDNIVESLYKIMCSYTTTAVDAKVENNDYFKRRVLGFRAEIEFEEFVKTFPKVNFLEGGQLISLKLSGLENEKNKFIYTTVDTVEPDVYIQIYSLMSNWDEVDKLFYVKLSDENWSEENFQVVTASKKTSKNGKEKKVRLETEDSILCPSFEFYEFNRNLKNFTKTHTQNFSCITNCLPAKQKKVTKFELRKRDQFNYLKEYKLEILLKIYAKRYFIDNVLSKFNKNLIDLDGFIQSGNDLVLVEIKEKSPAVPNIEGKKNDKKYWTYGWDSRRILWYLYLQKKITLSVLYNVRQIDNRSSRTFIQWDSLSIDDFLAGISWSASRGGGGGEDTLMAPYLYFKRLEDILAQL